MIGAVEGRTYVKAAIYARFSSDRQTDKSIDDQVALCRALCTSEGLAVAAVYDDRAISGASTLNRLGWQRLMRDAAAGHFDVVVAEALDRISRDQEDLAGIHKRLKFAGIAIRTVQDGIAGDIHIGVKGLLGALYLQDLAQKTRRGQAGVIRDGRHNGGRSFGYRPMPGKPGVLTIDEGEANTVRAIFTSYLEGQSPRDIAVALNRDHISGPRGGAWNASTHQRQPNTAQRNPAERSLLRAHRLESAKLREGSRHRTAHQPREPARAMDDGRRRAPSNC
jgi:DNA invertase Pin-like site-specific DNA recombinase